MGHERVGMLPHTKHWTDIVESIGQAAGNREYIPAIAATTLSTVQNRFQKLSADPGVVAAFRFLVTIATPSSTSRATILARTKSETALHLAARLRTEVGSARGKPEYAELARQAAADALIGWERRQSEPELFANASADSGLWRRTQSAAGFAEFARSFFSRLTERYLHYFLDRAASSASASVADREAFQQGLRDHVETLSRHAFETSKITQSFAAGWYNIHVRAGPPTSKQMQAFLHIALNKLAEELRREGGR